MRQKELWFVVMLLKKCVTITILKRYCISRSLISEYSLFLQNESRVLRVKVIAGIDLAKKDIIGAR